jgi:hypothetical protein
MKTKLTLAQAAGIYLDALDSKRELQRRRLGRTKRFQDVKDWLSRAETDLRKAVKHA